MPNFIEITMAVAEVRIGETTMYPEKPTIVRGTAPIVVDWRNNRLLIDGKGFPISRERKGKLTWTPAKQP